MKRLIILLVLAVSSLSANPKGVYYVKNIVPSDSLKLAGTGSDTSIVFDLYPYMTLDYAAHDTSGQDSVQVTPKIQTCTDTSITILGSAPWVTQETFSVNASDSTITTIVITDVPQPNHKYGRIIFTGGSANIKDSNLLLEAYLTGWILTTRN